MHGEQEFTPGIFGAEHIREDLVVPAKRLLPAVGSFANGVFQVGPQLPVEGVRVVDIAGDALGTVATQVRGRGRRIR